MKIKIKETGDIVDLIINDPQTGIEWTQDLLEGDYDYIEGDYDYDDDDEINTMYEEQYLWWEDYIKRRTKAEERLYDIVGDDVNIYKKYHELYNTNVEFEFIPEAMNEAMDELMEWLCEDE